MLDWHGLSPGDGMRDSPGGSKIPTRPFREWTGVVINWLIDRDFMESGRGE